MSEQLSGVTIVLIIGGGVILAVILFIFAKRQIMRFSLRSRRGPHIAIGHDAKKSLRKEVERKIEAIPKIYCEPQLISDHDIRNEQEEMALPYYCRFKAVDDVKLLESEISKQDAHLCRHPSESLRGYLLTALAPVLTECSQKMIHKFCDMYEHARHDPNDFQEKEYQVYQKLLLKLLETTSQIKSSVNSQKISPSRTLRKQHEEQILRPVLDASRLRVPTSQSQSIFKLSFSAESNSLNVENRPSKNLCSSSDTKINDNETSV
ncbi:uncharacterized protein C1orf43 homolog [Ctenocephalides felis]|uniref:uncharacterized protein C1orf43 homolog n=1 Tax=Ctenocephalides felis TaxID=7515 RepID=UPI000E6E2B43|nr:uncharacterized protein C1orf43 homolog [Ctenocephalides felis]XP_026476276.1 uncharacterized protein C1orf43 homolog [Ctenocephalides felis]